MKATQERHEFLYKASSNSKAGKRQEEHSCSTQQQIVLDWFSFKNLARKKLRLQLHSLS